MSVTSEGGGGGGGACSEPLGKKLAPAPQKNPARIAVCTMLINRHIPETRTDQQPRSNPKTRKMKHTKRNKRLHNTIQLHETKTRRIHTTILIQETNIKDRRTHGTWDDAPARKCRSCSRRRTRSTRPPAPPPHRLHRHCRRPLKLGPLQHLQARKKRLSPSSRPYRCRCHGHYCYRYRPSPPYPRPSASQTR